MDTKYKWVVINLTDGKTWLWATDSKDYFTAQEIVDWISKENIEIKHIYDNNILAGGITSKEEFCYQALTHTRRK